MNNPEVIMTLRLHEVTEFGGFEKDLTFRGYSDGEVYMERCWIHPSENTKSQFHLTDVEYRMMQSFKEMLDERVARSSFFEPRYSLDKDDTVHGKN